MIVVTGGSGFLGGELISRLIKTNEDILVVARNEGNLVKLKDRFPTIRIMSGDIADECTCKKALKGCNTLYHLAAFKHVPMAENEVEQCIKSNTIGTLNLLRNFKGKMFVSISTDKAAQVTGVYGATKMLMERAIKEYEKVNDNIQYRIVRYGNVLYSTGSVLCKWKYALQNGLDITVTDISATRYFWSIEQAVDLIFDCIENAIDSTVYCPIMKSIEIKDLLEAMQIKYGRAKHINVIGLQKGENLHEKVLEDGVMSCDSDRYTVEEIMEMV